MMAENTSALTNFIEMTDNIERYTNLINNANDVEMFIFLTDCHTHYTGTVFNKKNDGFDLLTKYVYNLPINFVLNGGDWLNMNRYYKPAVSYLGFLNGITKQTFKKYYQIVGNHDTVYLYYTDAKNKQRIGKLNNRLVKNVFMPECENTYYEFDGISTHFYIFNTEILEVIGANLTDFHKQQIHWVASKLITNTHPHIAFGMHIWYGHGDNIGVVAPFGVELKTLINSFNSRQTYEFDNEEYDFTNSTGRIEFVIAGHTHIDTNDNVSSGSGGVPVVITTDFKHGGIQHTFDMIYVDYDNRKLYCVRAGYGSDRTFDLDTGEMI